MQIEGYSPKRDQRRDLGSETEDMKRMSTLRAALERLPMENIDEANVTKIAMGIFPDVDMATIRKNLRDVALLISPLVPKKSKKLEEVLKEEE